MFRKNFRMDAARWVRPQQVADWHSIGAGTALKLLWRYLALQPMLWLRFAQWCRSRHIPLGGLIQKWITLVYGLEIAVGAEIGGGLYIPHPVGSVIAPEKIGENCTIIGAVTIGMRNDWKFPRIGSNVFIGAGARILGGITIGDGAVIGANAVVIDDVPPGATVVGIPARVIRVDGKRVEPAADPSFEQGSELQISL